MVLDDCHAIKEVAHDIAQVLSLFGERGTSSVERHAADASVSSGGASDWGNLRSKINRYRSVRRGAWK